MAETKLSDIPIAVLADGKRLELNTALRLVSYYYKQELEAVQSAIGHEFLSMSPAAVCLLAGDWSNAVALGLSAPILRTLARERDILRTDVRKLERIAEHFSNYGNPRILHALGLQLEGLPTTSLPETENHSLNVAAYRVHNLVCPYALRKISENYVTTRDQGKKQSSLAKTRVFFRHVGHDLHAIAAHPGAFFSDMNAGWRTVGKQARSLCVYFHSAAHAQPVVPDPPAPPQNPGMADRMMAWIRSMTDAPQDEKEARAVREEYKRIARAKQKVLQQMKTAAPTFVLENGFVVTEFALSAGYFHSGEYGMCLTSLFAGVMGLRPAQVLGRRNAKLFAAFEGERSHAAPDSFS